MKKSSKCIVGPPHGNSSKSYALLLPEYFLNFFLKASRFYSSVNSSFLTSTRRPSSSGWPISILQLTSSRNMGACDSRYLTSYSVEPSLRPADSSSSKLTRLLRCRLIPLDSYNFQSAIGLKRQRPQQQSNSSISHYFGVLHCLNFPSLSNKIITMNSQQLPPIQSSQKRYGSSIPSGRISQFAPTQVPIISKRGTSKAGSSNALSMHDITDPALIDQKLKSLSHTESDIRISMEIEKKEKANLKFLRYKFNPNSKEDEGENVQRGRVEQYGQLGRGNREKITVNIFYELKNVLFQDERAPLIYKKLFLEKEQH